jgi:hypothetical protein
MSTQTNSHENQLSVAIENAKALVDYGLIDQSIDVLDTERNVYAKHCFENNLELGSMWQKAENQAYKQLVLNTN